MSVTFRLVVVALCMFASADTTNAQTAFYRAPPSAVAGAPGTLGSAGGDRWRPAGRHDLPRALSFDRPGQQANPGVGRRDRAAWRSAAGRQADRGLGAPDFRGRAAVRAVAGDLPVRADPGAALVCARRLCGRCNRLSGTRDREAAPLPCRHQRGPRRNRFRARRRPVARCGRRQEVRGLGPFAGRPCRAVHRHYRKTYAPELDLLGVAAAAPATDLVTLMNEDIDSVGGKNITAMTLWSWQRVFGANMDKVVDRRAMPAIDQLAQECIEGPFDLRRRQLTEQPLEQYFLNTKHPSDVEPWHTLLAQNSPGTLPSDIPVFLAQGTDDVIIRPKVTEDYAAALCAAGSTVRIFSMPNIGHSRAAQASTQDMLDWTSDRFAGKPASDDCSRR